MVSAYVTIHAGALDWERELGKLSKLINSCCFFAARCYCDQWRVDRRLGLVVGCLEDMTIVSPPWS